VRVLVACGSCLVAVWQLGSCLVIGEVVCSRCTSYPVCGVWPPASRGGQLPGALGMTAGGPRQPSLAQFSASDSEDRSPWTKRADWLADVVAELLRWSLNY
jgi:hypothetical protein